MEFKRESDPRAGRKLDCDTSELVGLVKGMLADGQFVQAEAEALIRWLHAHEQHRHAYPFDRIFARVEDALIDGVLDDDEANDLAGLLLQLTSSPESNLQEMATGKAAPSLPLDVPAPEVVFDRRNFVVTGTFDYGSRKDVHAAIEARGGNICKAVTTSTDYLIIGNRVTDSWKTSAGGRKIIDAAALRQRGSGRLAIISEVHWTASL